MAFRCDIPARSTVQLDDAFARITRWDFAPGAVTGWHEHGLPYFVTMLVAGMLAIDDGAAVTEVTLGAGQSYRRSAGIKHDVKRSILLLQASSKERHRAADFIKEFRLSVAGASSRSPSHIHCKPLIILG